MSTPEQPPPQQSPPSGGYGPPSGYGGGWSPGGPPGIGAIMPVPGNAELVVYILATIVVAIIVLASDSVDAGFFIEFFKWATLGYLISRGIAKASRVLER